MPTLDFKGKNYVYAHHLSVPFRALNIVPENSMPKDGKPSMDDNLIIQGDNLHALKALLPQYAGKVKCIYIDPPYNTGNEGWCYNDKVNSPLIKKWLEDSANPVDKEDMERHDKWLCMMWPRLQLLRELLAEDGSIWISIDDDEQGNLRTICDETFGKDNFINNIIWQKKYSPANDAKWLSDNHDFILCYAKDRSMWKPNLLPRTAEQNNRYSNPDDDPRGDWKSSDMSVKTYSEKYDYEITTPSGRKVNPPQSRCWRVGKEGFEKLLKENRIWFGVDGNNVPSIKKFLTEVKQGVTSLTLWPYKEVGHNQTAKNEIKEIFYDKDKLFDTPKPVPVLKKILTLATSAGDIVLDSFAGSGTTAHAVLDLNKEDGGNRKFILVEMEDYANDITAERVRRVVRGVPDAKDDSLKEGLGGSFTYCELGKPFDIEDMLKGDNLPDYQALAKYVFYTATGHSLDSAVKPTQDYFIGETDLFKVYLIYKDDLEYLRSNDSALSQDKLNVITAKKSTKQKIIFATAKYMSQSALSEHKVTFCQIPYAIHKIAGN